MHFATLASGSSGNSILVGNGNENLLVDCGINAKRLLCNFSAIGIDAKSIKGIVITHEHHDHIKGVGALARKLKVPVYATNGLWRELRRNIGELAPGQEVDVLECFSCAGMQVHLFPTSHDSTESYGMRIELNHGNKQKVVGIVTDTGAITTEMDAYLTGCDALIVEANHDKEKLWNGRYPWYLKKRIASERGHLNNLQIAEGLLIWVKENTQKVVLAHLSEENNTPEIALTTVLRILRTSHVAKQTPGLRLRVAPRYTPLDLVVLG